MEPWWLHGWKRSVERKCLREVYFLFLFFSVDQSKWSIWKQNKKLSGCYHCECVFISSTVIMVLYSLSGVCACSTFFFVFSLISIWRRNWISCSWNWYKFCVRQHSPHCPACSMFAEVCLLTSATNCEGWCHAVTVWSCIAYFSRV